MERVYKRHWKGFYKKKKEREKVEDVIDFKLSSE